MKIFENIKFQHNTPLKTDAAPTEKINPTLDAICIFEKR